jgi:hypothetical protein
MQVFDVAERRCGLWLKVSPFARNINAAGLLVLAEDGSMTLQRLAAIAGGTVPSQTLHFSEMANPDDAICAWAVIK